MKETKIRIISSLIAIPFLIAVVALGGIFLELALIFCSLVGLYEFYRAVNKDLKPINNIGYLFSIIYVLGIPSFVGKTQTSFFVFVSLFLLTLLIVMIASNKKTNIRDVENTFIGFFYVCFLLSHILLVRIYTHGEIYVWLIFITAWGSDTGAYFIGRNFGKHKLAPELSPKKTIEGSLGGIFFSAILCVLYGISADAILDLDIESLIIRLLFIGVIGSVIAQIGDLTASAIKRYTGVKDYGKILPGHGGILDRFDSVLFTAPLVYYLVILLERII